MRVTAKSATTDESVETRSVLGLVCFGRIVEFEVVARDVGEIRSGDRVSRRGENFTIHARRPRRERDRAVSRRPEGCAFTVRRTARGPRCARFPGTPLAASTRVFLHHIIIAVVVVVVAIFVSRVRPFRGRYNSNW